MGSLWQLAPPMVHLTNRFPGLPVPRSITLRAIAEKVARHLELPLKTAVQAHVDEVRIAPAAHRSVPLQLWGEVIDQHLLKATDLSNPALMKPRTAELDGLRRQLEDTARATVRRLHETLSMDRRLILDFEFSSPAPERTLIHNQPVWKWSGTLKPRSREQLTAELQTDLSQTLKLAMHQRLANHRASKPGRVSTPFDDALWVGMDPKWAPLIKVEPTLLTHALSRMQDTAQEAARAVLREHREFAGKSPHVSTSPQLLKRQDASQPQYGIYAKWKAT